MSNALSRPTLSTRLGLGQGLEGGGNPCMTTEGLRGEIVRWMGEGGGGGGGDGIGKTFPARAFARAPEPPGDGFPGGN
jgi:hypothetical protein